MANLANNFVLRNGRFELELNNGSEIDSNFALQVVLPTNKSGIRIETNSFSSEGGEYGLAQNFNENSIDKSFDTNGNAMKVKVMCFDKPVKCFFKTL